jgi:hypothetical protein
MMVVGGEDWREEEVAVASTLGRIYACLVVACVIPSSRKSIAIEQRQQ